MPILWAQEGLNTSFFSEWRSCSGVSWMWVGPCCNFSGSFSSEKQEWCTQKMVPAWCFLQPFWTALVSLGLLLCHPSSPEVITAFASSHAAVSSAKACFGTQWALVRGWSTNLLVCEQWHHRPSHISGAARQEAGLHVWDPILFSSLHSQETLSFSLASGYLFPLGFCNITINIKRNKENKIWKFWAQIQSRFCRMHKIQMCKQKKKDLSTCSNKGSSAKIYFNI